jgi:glycosyltransferase involved in cell wall biosynthesis
LIRCLFLGSKIKVLTCIQDASETGGGVAVVANSVHLGLIKSGVNAQMFCGLLPRSKSDVFQNIETSTKSSASFFKSKKSEKIVHVHGLWTPFVLKACIEAKKNDVPLVISPHGMLENWAINHKFWKKKLAWLVYQKKILKMADLLIVNSYQELDTVRRHGLLGRVAVIENGVDTTHLAPVPIIKDKKKNVLFLSRLTPVKGLPDLIESWSKLPTGHDYELRLYGHADAGYEFEIDRLIKLFKVTESVKVLGGIFGGDKWEVYQRASFFVLPSYGENFGIVVAEALLAGLPVITTHATPWECLEKEGVGIQVANDIEQLSGAIWQMMQLTRHERQKISERATAYANENFLWPKVIHKYTQTYEWLLSTGKPGPVWIDSL